MSTAITYPFNLEPTGPEHPFKRQPDGSFGSASLVELLQVQSRRLGDKRLTCYLRDGQEEHAHLSFRDLQDRARRIGAWLSSRHQEGERALLLFPPGLSFTEAFFGCLYAGIVAVPMSMPPLHRMDARLEAILTDATPSCVLTADPDLGTRLKRRDHAMALPIYSTAQIAEEAASDVAFVAPQLHPDSVAYLQYTSGSTSTPKGVMVTHRNVLQNCAIFADSMQVSPDDIVVTWLPHFHDMGLVFGIVLPLYAGASSVSMSPVSFLRQPQVWLKAISRYRGTLSAAPNFAFDLCTSKISGDERDELDLSSLRGVINGAEPVRKDTMDRFAEKFGNCGFSPAAFCPGYGLAEATLAVSLTPPGRGPTFDRLDFEALKSGRAVAALPGAPGARDFACCGPTYLDTRIAIVNAETGARSATGEIGEIWVGGSSVAAGYWNSDGATQETFAARVGGEGPFLRTGDLGYVANEQLHVVGRIKDVIIVRGRNYYPQDIEALVSSEHEAFEQNGAAAFAVSPDELPDGRGCGADERVVVFQELKRRHRNADTAPLARVIQSAVRRELDLEVFAVVFLEPRQLPRTSSGKVQRRACRTAFLENRGPWITVVRCTPPQEAESTPLSDAGVSRVLRETFENVFGIHLTAPDWQQPLADFGLESLKAVQLCHDLTRRLGVSIGLETLLGKASLAELEEQILAHGGDERPADDIPALVANPGDALEPFPLTEVQQAYWIGRSDQLELGGVGCHGYLEFECRDLDEARLEQAVNELVRRHQALRTIVRSDGLQQVMAQVPRFNLDVRDLRELGPTERERALGDTRTSLSHRVFDPGQWPLFGVRVSRLGERLCRVHVNLDLLVLDYWSIGILSDELRSLYEDPGARLPELAISFRDCVLAMRASRDTAAHAAAVEYWRERARALPPAPALPLARPPSAVERPTFTRRKQRLDKQQWARLRAAARRHGITPSSAILAAFREVLARFSASDRFTVTVTLLDRPPMHPQIGQVVGDFTSLVLSSTGDLADDRQDDLPQVFGAKAAAVQQDLWRDLGRPRVSAVRVLRERNAEAGFLTIPVVFTCALDGGRAGSERPFGWLGEELFSVSQTPQVWLDHQVTEDREGLVLSWDAVDELFPDGLLDSMWATYGRLLEALASRPETWAEADPTSLPPAELTPRTEANATDATVPAGLLHDRFVEAAARQPDALAVIAPSRSLTYRELDDLSNALGRKLRSLGARPNTLVAVAMDKSVEQLVAVLAVLKAGAAYLPVDPSLPGERLQEILRQGRVALVLTQHHHDTTVAWPEQVTRIAVDTFCGTHDGGAPEAETAGPPDDRWSTAPLDVAQASTDLAYVIFTSGSTGKPKGVMIDHRGALNTIDDINRRFQVRPADRVLALSALSFDLSVYDIFGMLAAGAALVLPDPKLSRDPAHWRELVTKHAVSVWNTVPALMQMLVEHTAGDGAALPHSLRLVMLSGDWIPVALPARLRPLCRSELQLISLGGATEASIWSIWHPVTSVEPTAKSIPYGKPLANQQMHVLDARMRPCPQWVPGRLYIAGVGLALGYWADPARTQERFVTHPLTGERLYWTGDLGRYLPDGSIEFLGREDHQVKIQGYRIELGDIEAALLQHPDVQAAVAHVTTSPGGSKLLVGYFVPRPSAAHRDAPDNDNGAPGDSRAPRLDPAVLQAFVARKLPAYMVPALWVELERLPLGVNGKLDRKALPSPLSLQSSPSDTAQRAAGWERLRPIAADLLKKPDLSPSDDFFQLGGDSLLATQLVARLRHDLALDLPLQLIFEHPRLGDLAALLADQAPAATDSHEARQLVRPDPEHRFEPFALTDVQRAYWVGRDESLQLGGVACQGYVELDTDTLDVPRLEAAWQRLVERHEMLRAVVARDGRQRILEAAPRLHIERLDLRGLSTSEQRTRLAEQRERLSHAVLPADRAPLVHVQVSQLDDRRMRVHLNADLLVMDYWSFRVVITELQAFYQDPTLRLPPLSLSFRDYLLAEQQVQTTESYARSLDYWRRRLETLPPAPRLPLIKDPSAITRPRFARRQARIAPALWQQLRAGAQADGLSPSGLLLAAFSEVLARFSTEPTFTVNLTLFNRRPVHPEVNQLVGDFTSVTLLAVDGRQPSFRERARAIQRQLWEDLDHRSVSGVRVLRELASHANGSTLMPVVFTSTLGNSDPDQPPPLAWLGEEVFSVSQTPQVWLDHQVTEDREGLVLSWDAVEELFPDGLLDSMWATYGRLLEALASRPETWAEADPTSLPPAELAPRTEANATDAPVPAGLLHDRFVEAAARQPDALAVIAPSRTLTYRELDDLSNALGRKLRSLGARPNTLVAVAMDKSVEQLVAVLAVLKAGAAYLPVDPSLPGERLQEILRQGQVTLVLTQYHHDTTATWPEQVTRIAVDTFCGTHDGGAPEADTAGPPDDRWSTAPVDVAQASTDLAYVIFTSGSTGKPKGVMIDHRGALNTIDDINRRFQVRPADRVLALSALSFDLSVYDIFGMLAAGAALVLPDPKLSRDPAHWRELVAKHAVSVWNTVPALMQMLVEHTAGDGAALPHSLRLVMLSGDWIPVALPARMRPLCRSELQLISLGGATEASIWSIWHPITSVEPDASSIPYGKPLANQQMHVLDARMRPCPQWVPGRLYIAGVGLALGYWADPARTQERFVTHPLTGERLYWTGDLGRYLPDGSIEFLGREDHQVKIQGYRIELGDIEAALLQHPDVQAAVAHVTTSPSGSKLLVGYFVPRPSAAHRDAPDNDNGAPGDSRAPRLDPAVLQAFVARKLPAYMVPALWVELERLPLGVNGKVDRKALPSPLSLQSSPSDTAQRAAGWERLRPIAADLLKKPDLSPSDDFFQLGGDSLLATQLVARLRHDLALDFPLQLIFEHPRLGDLAGHLSRRAQPESGASSPAAPEQGASPAPAFESFPDARHEPFALTDVQSAYLIGRTGAAELGRVACQGYIELESESLDLDRLQKAFERLVERHEMLRAVIDPDGRQRILPEAPPFALQRADLRHLSPTDRDDALAQLRQRLSHLVLPVDEAPLFRIQVTDLSPTRTRIHVNVDLLVMDYWSFRLVASELEALYEQPDVALEPLSVSFRDYVTYDQRLRGTDVDRRSSAYWEARAARLPAAPQLPLAAPLAAIERPRFHRRQARLAPALWQALKQRAQAEGLTSSVVVLTAFSELLARFCTEPDFTINLTLFNRAPVHPEIHRLVGDFTTVTLLEVHLRQPTFIDRARAIQQRLWEDLDHRAVSGVRVLRELARARHNGRAALMPVVFTSLLGHTDSDQEPALSWLGSEVFSVSQTPQVLLDHQVTEDSAGLLLIWDCVEDAFPAGLLDLMFSTYTELLQRLAVAADAFGAAEPVALAPLAQAADHHVVLDQQGRPCPPWVRGKVYVSGRVAYLREPPVGTEPTTDEPAFHPITGAPIVWSGRWGRYRLDGTIDVFDAGAASTATATAALEAENALLRHARVADAAVVDIADAHQPPQLVAYTTLRDTAPSPTVATPAAPRMLLDPVAKLRFKLGKPGIRRDLATPSIPLVSHEPTAEPTAALVKRRTFRTFSRSPISAERFSDLLGCLAHTRLPGLPIPKQLYGSAGGLYPVQTYVYVKEGRIEALPPGTYYYNPAHHQLVPIATGSLVSPAAYDGPNRRIFDESAFSMYLVAERRAIEPIYGSWWHSFALLEAGIMTQLLETHAPDCYVGLCQVGAFDFQRVRSHFALGDSHEYLHGLIGGGISAEDLTIEALQREAEPLRRMIAAAGLQDQNGADHDDATSWPELGAESTAAAPADTTPAPTSAAASAPDRQVPGQNVDLDALCAELVEHVRAALPNLERPIRIAPFDELPRTAAGRVDRESLRRRAECVPGPEKPAARIPDETEQALILLWQAVLSLERVGVDDDFFSIGGNSLLVIQLLQRIKERFGVHLPVTELFDRPTVATQATCIREHLQRPAPGGTTGGSHRDAVPASGVTPLTTGQRWFFHCGHFQDASRYNMASLANLRAPLHPPVLQRAVRALIQRHDALRARFVRSGDTWSQYIPPTSELDGSDSPTLYSFVASPASDASAQDEVIHTTAVALQSEMELGRGYLFRIAHFDFGPGTPQRLLFIVHHLIMDAGSQEILLADLETTYAQLCQGDDLTLPPVTTPLRPWALAVEDFAHSPELTAQADYWLSISRDKIHSLPLDFPASTLELNTVDTSESVVRLFGRDSLPGLAEAARRMGSSIADLLLMVFSSTLLDWTGDDALLLKVMSSGRFLLPSHRALDVSRTVGPFAFGSLCFFTRFRGNDPSERARDFQRQLHAIPGGGLGPEMLVQFGPDPRIVEPMRDILGRNQILFNYYIAPDLGASKLLDAFTPYRTATRRAEDRRPDVLECTVVQSNDGLSIELSFSRRLHRRATVEALAEALDVAIRRWTAWLARHEDAPT